MKYIELFVFVILSVIIYKLLTAYLKMPSWATL